MNSNFKWYMISTIRGKEEQVLEALRNRIIAENVAESFNNEATENGAFKMFTKPTLTPKEMEKKRLNEPYKIKYVNIYPGYIFANMDMTDEAWYVLRNTQYVTGIIGSSGKGAKPTPVSNSEIRKMTKAEVEYQKMFNEGKNLLDLKLGDLVEVIDGPYKGEIGPISLLDIDKDIAIVELESFGKKVKVEFAIELLKPSDTYL
ncbi:transcription termination/antitermination protein NusG [Mycoplasmopsis verecunda]|uniref:Transcription termination/antitermination protein NusG n=1 Tax=Mycoplasmopsis verecunda TaxID=171291 RepID=A0A1T4L6U7_9BACT|nr:transcription termination/antitermination protein NusG [Mycoplasmopsis verecunda]WPB54779.1 transcription termination/antitermination protein NusG [Mycoplasmopsis verecunda]SJZ50328.1 transcriptional antiterminator NusG [Mycoplasmopsis verecunda]